MKLQIVVSIATITLGCAGLVSPVAAQTANAPPVVHLIWMGGNDCPPCVAWRRFDLPKLEQSSEFKLIKFSYVQKAIQSPVPPRFFLPSDVAAYKEKLDEASSGRGGSPQAAVLVDGKVFDYFHGTRTAEDIEKMLVAIRTGTPYPFPRCIKVSKEWRKCETAG